MVFNNKLLSNGYFYRYLICQIYHGNAGQIKVSLGRRFPALGGILIGYGAGKPAPTGKEPRF